MSLRFSSSVCWACLCLLGCASQEVAPLGRDSGSSLALGAPPEDRGGPQRPALAQGPTAGATSAQPNEAVPTGGLRPPTPEELATYGWLEPGTKVRSLSETISAPQGFTRVAVADKSFGAFLRALPLRAADAPVRTYAGEILHVPGDRRVSAVAELDLSPTDIQQCADSVIRMHAEWKWSRGQQETIGYHFLSGDFASWPKYASGVRAQVEGNKVAWVQTAAPSNSHATFRKYLDLVFNYASTISLDKRSSDPIAKAELAPGDFFVLPGGPGHAILILDVAEDASGKRVALLGQGFMPAQDFHVLRDASGSAWFSLDGDAVDTPFWPAPFPWSSLRRMK